MLVSTDWSICCQIAVVSFEKITAAAVVWKYVVTSCGNKLPDIFKAVSLLRTDEFDAERTLVLITLSL